MKDKEKLLTFSQVESLLQSYKDKIEQLEFQVKIQQAQLKDIENISKIKFTLNKF